jgi:membrane-bound serine protease (ClpP class)
MRRRLLLLLLAVIGFSPALIAAETVIVPLEGQVSKAQLFFLRRAIKDAESANASAVVIHMDTYGGDLHAAVKIVDVLQKTSLPSAVFVDGNAGSAGAMIALGADKIYMSPVSAIGAAAPVMGGGEDLPETMNDKTVSYFSKYFRSAAEQNGHNPDIAEAVINKKKEVKIGEKVISEEDSLLTLSAQEAVEIHEGKPLLALGIVESPEEAALKAGFPTTTRTVVPTGFEKVAQWITLLSPIILFIAIAGAYIEFKTPGFGIPGGISIAAFAIFFLGHYVAGLAGMELMAVFALGIILVILEIFLLPGTLFLGLTGAALMIGSLLWAMIDRYPGDAWIPNADTMTMPLLNLLLAFAAATVLAILFGKYLPQIPFARRLMLTRSVSGGAPTGGSADLPAGGYEETGSVVRPGDRGTAITPLRPSGKASIRANVHDVTTPGLYLDAQTPIVVVEASRGRIVVDKAPDGESDS